MHKYITKAYCLIILLFSISANADLVTYQVSATVYDVYDPGYVLQGSINLGNTISGTYTFETNVPDEDPSAEYALYNQTYTGASGFDLVVNNHSIKSDNTIPGFMHEVFMGNSITDYLHIGSWGNTPLNTGALVNDIFLDLYDDTGTAFSNTAIPTSPPNVNNFTQRDLILSGSDPAAMNYYHVMASIDSISTDPAGTPNSNLVSFNVVANVKDVWDPGNALGSSVQIGGTLQGSYTFNTSTPDMDASQEIGVYRHFPGSGEFGFALTAGDHNFNTNPNNVEFTIDMYNGTPSPDHYAAFSYGANFPLSNGATVEDIGLHIYDEFGGILTSTQLSNTPPVLPSSSAGIKEVYIWGRHPNGIDSYHIIADIQQITMESSDSLSLVAISPASGIFDRAQRFDMAIILQPNLAPVMDMFVTINGFDETPSLYSCSPGAPNNQNRQTMVCPDYSSRMMPMLQPGMNRLDFRFVLGDGTILIESVEWEMIGF